MKIGIKYSSQRLLFRRAFYIGGALKEAALRPARKAKAVQCIDYRHDDCGGFGTRQLLNSPGNFF
jgi:hypothetical protein